MHLRVVFQGSVPKDESPDATNDDNVAADEKRQRFAISDGATESYHPALWSRILCEGWTAGTRAATRTALQESIRSYEAACDPPSLSWSKQAAFERGSFATLIGLELRNHLLRIVAFGDSIIVGWPIAGEINSFPYSTAEEFDQRPLLLSTRMDANTFALQRQLVRASTTLWPLAPGTVLLAMTDALGQWLLQRNAEQEARQSLATIRTVEQLQQIVSTERAAGTMRRDDTTLLHLQAEAS